MNVVITPPSGPVSGTVKVPGSKSVANRALVCAMLAEGQSVISNLPDGDDTQVIIDVLSQLSSCVVLQQGVVAVNGHKHGKLPGIVDAGLAGTSSRFLTAVAALSESTTVVDGGEPLRGRPMADLHNALRSLGAEVTPLGVVGHLPVSVSRGTFNGGSLNIRGDVSSQFISALMLIGPVLPQGLQITIDGPLVSESYVQMTARVMESFGGRIQFEGSDIRIESTGYQACDYVIEPDFSSAAFPLVGLALRGGDIRIPHLAEATMQGDSRILQIMQMVGVVVQVDGNDIVFRKDSSGSLLPLNINMQDCSDLVPAVAVLCSVAEGASEITGVGFIRNKESDRIGDLAKELQKCGVRIEELPDGLRVIGEKNLHNAHFDPHHDHRLAMALALTALHSGRCTVSHSEVVSKSWPSYFTDMATVLGNVQAEH